VQRLFNPPPCASTGKRGGTVSYLTPQSKCVASPALAAAHTVGLSWDASTSPNIVGYNVYRGSSANGPYTKINSSLDPNTTYSDTTVRKTVQRAFRTRAATRDRSLGLVGIRALDPLVVNRRRDIEISIAALDGAGDLYGTAYQGGAGYGVVFELMLNTNGHWTEKVLHTFSNAPAGNPVAGLVMDTAGNLYGTTMLGATQSSCGGGCSSLFKLSPVSGGGWTYKMVHVFGQGTDGYHPTGDLILDSAGNIYGTTQAGGAQGSGIVFEIMH
jgi:hypothetical protein